MKELGIEPILLLAQIVNFGIIFFVLKKFLYKPILAMLDKRKKELDEGLALSQKMIREEEKLKEKEAAMTLQAKKEAKTLLDQAKKQAEEQKKQIVVEAHEEAAKILAKAKTQAEGQAKAAEEATRAQAVELAVAMTERLIPEVLSEGDHRKLMTAKLKELEKSVKITN